MKIKFNYEKETKNTIRFHEDNEENPAIGTLYVQKSTLEAIKYNMHDKGSIEVEISVAK